MLEDSQADSLDPDPSEAAPRTHPSGDIQNPTPEELVLPPRPWGPWATVGWTLVVIVALVVTQAAALVVAVAYRITTGGSANIANLATDGNFLALATLLSTPVTVGLVALIIYFRGYPMRDYLALYWPPARSILIALAGLAAVLVATDLTSYLLGRPLVPTVMVDVYRTVWLPALLVAMVVLAPIGEETLFRGFLFMGIAASRAGPVVAIIVSTVAFAVLHLQYDLLGIAAVAAIGFYLGVVRYRSRSLFLTMFLHAVANAFATLELVVQEQWLK
jgi:uncharacterized protein